MDNLTKTYNVYRPHNGLDPLQGYAVVVYEQKGESGEEFRGIVEPGRPFRKPFLKNVSDYLTFAVNLAPALRFTFSEHYRLDDQIHECDVKFDLAYYVSDAEKIATGRNADPLRQLRDEITRRVGRDIVRSSWALIQREFRRLETEIIPKALSDLQPYAAELGFGLTGIVLTVQLPEKEIEVELLKDSAVRDGQIQAITQESEDRQRVRQHQLRLQEEQDKFEIEKVQLENELILTPEKDRLHHVRQMRKLKEDMIEGGGAAIKNVGQGISTPSELQEGLGVMQQMFLGNSPGSTNPTRDTFQEGLMPGHSFKQLSAAGGERWMDYVASSLREINSWPYPTEQKRALSSAILHLIAELLLDDRATEETLQRYAEQIAERSREFNPPLSPAQSRSLKEFQHYETLRRVFK